MTREAQHQPAPASPDTTAAAARENFAVLSPLLSADLRRDFATVYACCRALDDAGDNPDRTPDQRLQDLARWRTALTAALNNETPEEPPAHPDLWPRLAELARRRSLNPEPFHHLIDAFERDQRQTTYATWDDLLTYCQKSANPVGRIILQLGSIDPADEHNAPITAHADTLCTALQLINFWQDTRRDLLDLGRVYMPTDETHLPPDDLRAMANTPNDPAARVRFIKALRPLVTRTSDMFDDCAPLPDLLAKHDSARTIAPAVALFHMGGVAITRRVERVGCATLWKRPTLTRLTRARILAAACVRFALR